MRPISLSMKAFGSFGAETTVEFDQLKGGLYLIVGKTGAGKTMIFDAISFALFGVPSGSERTAEMMHSDFAEKSVDTEVTLRFSHRGQEYRVWRSLHFPRQRGKTNEYGKSQPDAEFFAPEQPPLRGAGRVTARCEELLGLNAEQFRRIVMLAQGEFRRFLNAKGDERNAILGRLFDNTEVLRYQNLLAATRDLLRARREEKEAALRSLLTVQLRLPEGANPEDYHAEHPRLLENLEALQAGDEAALTALREQNAEARDAVDRLNLQKGAAEASNALLTEQEQKRSRLQALEERAPAAEAAQTEWARAERAIHAVLPKVEALRREERALAQAREELSRQEAQLAQEEEKLAAAQRAVEEAQPQRLRQDAVRIERQLLQDTMPRYRELNEKETARAAAEKAQDALSLRLAASLQRQEALTGRLAALRREIDASEGAEAAAVQLRGALELAKERWEALTAPRRGLEARMAAIERDEKELRRKETALAGLIEAAGTAEERHHRLYRALLAGQAGQLGAALEKELTEKGEARCQVCGSVFHRGEDHAFACPAAETPSEQEVERAQAAMKKAEAERSEAAAAVEKARALLLQEREAAADQAARLDPALKDWARLSAPETLPALRAALQEALEQAQKAANEADQALDRRRKAQTEEKDRRAESENLEKALAADKKEQEEGASALLRLTVDVDALRRQLPYPDEAAAIARLGGMTKELDELSAALAAKDEALQDARKNRDRLQGVTANLRAALPERERLRSAAETERDADLQAAGFADMADWEAALAPVGTMDGEAWLEQRRQKLEAYRHELESLRERLGELAEQTEGLEPVDLEALQADLQAANGELNELGEATATRSALLMNHREVLQRARLLRGELQGTAGAAKRIETLAGLAVGLSSDEGRLSFDRYVMGAVFREVLDKANERLNVMTGGQFELVHTIDAGRKNAVAGLEIQVRDVLKDTLRDSGSVSGGESFLVSLALALGLSDVVQLHAGGQKLDTLFIDEGFGSLDEGKLDNVITGLQQLTEGNRLVGLISHVDKLEESIPQKIRVRRTEHGSELSMELS